MSGFSIKVGDVDDVVRSLQRAKAAASIENRELARAIVFVGAGCSRSAGVPLASEIAQRLVVDLAKTYRRYDGEESESALTALRGAGYFKDCIQGDLIDWYAVYDEAFSEHYKSPDSARDIFKKEIHQANACINWAHLCIGELVARGYFSTVMTTNFDLLALQGLAAAGVIPVVSDGLESLSRIDGSPEYPQLIQLNGSIHSYRLRNRPDEIDAVGKDKIAASCFRDLVRNARTIIFVGYAGREKAIMGLLQSALTEFYEKELYWCIRGGDAGSLSEGAASLLVNNPNARVIVGQDADAFFYRLSRGLGVGAPRLIASPFSTMLDQVEKVSLPGGADAMEDIRDEIARVKSRISSAVNNDSSVNGGFGDLEGSAVELARNARFKGDDKGALKILEDRLGDETSSTELRMLASLAYDVAEKSGSIADIERAVAYANRLVEAIDKDEDSVGWATAKILQGNAVDMAAMENASAANAKDAVSHYEAALEILPIDHPERSHAYNNMAVAYARSGDMNGNREDLEKSLEICDMILSEFSKDERIDKSYLVSNKATAHLSLGELLSDDDHLQRSILFAREALSMSPNMSTDRIAGLWMTLASGLSLSGRLTNNAQMIREAIQIFDGKQSSALVAVDRVGAALNKAHSLLALGKLEASKNIIADAIACYAECVKYFERQGLSYQKGLAENGRELAQAAHAATLD